jgi:hypothetical protein
MSPSLVRYNERVSCHVLQEKHPQCTVPSRCAQGGIQVNASRTLNKEIGENASSTSHEALP